MSENTRGSSKKRKAISATLTVAMVATMLLSGTLAYFYQSRAKNTITGTEKQVIGHDDFVKVNDSKYDKDIYVENMGTTPVLVRVKLTEAFTLNGKTIVDAADKLTHIPQNKDTLNVGTGTNDSDQTANDIHKYFTWKMDGTAKNYISGNSTLYQSDEDKDVFYSYEVGKVAQNNSKKTYTAASIDADTSLSAAMKTDLKENLKKTLSGNIITMQEYMQNTPSWRENFTGWVIDNSKTGDNIKDATGNDAQEVADGDGWAYWSQMLGQNQATSLLLTEVAVDPALTNADYTYDIYVDFEAVDTTEKGIWTAGNQPADENMPIISIEEIKTTGANALITAAENAYQTHYGDKAAQIDVIRQRTDSKAVLALCNGAESRLSNGTLSPKTNQQIAQTYIDMANAILSKQETTAGQAELATPVLIYKNGAVNSGGTISSMDPNLAKFIMDTYDYDGNGTLTEEEALSVIELKVPTITVSGLDGLNLDNFKNLRSLWLNGTDGYSSLDLNQFTKEIPVPGKTEKEKVGLHTLILYRGNSLTGEINVSLLKDTLKYLQIDRTSANVSVSGLNQLQNTEYLYFYQTPSVKLTPTDICDLLHKSASTLSTFAWEYTNIYSNATYSTKISNLDDLTNATATDGTAFAIPTSIQLLYFEDKTVTGTLSLNNLQKLKTLIFGGNPGLTCNINACDTLQLIKKTGGAQITGTWPSAATVQ